MRVLQIQTHEAAPGIWLANVEHLLWSEHQSRGATALEAAESLVKHLAEQSEMILGKLVPVESTVPNEQMFEVEWHHRRQMPDPSNN